MGTFGAGGLRGASIELSLVNDEPYAILPQYYSTGDTSVLDGIVRTYGVSAGVTGNQYKINCNIVRDPSFGAYPTVSFESSNSGVATVTSLGAVKFASTGTTRIAINITQSYYGAQTLYKTLTFATGVSAGVNISEKIPAAIGTGNILVVYNASNPESVEVKDYYLANRPGFSSVRALGLNCASGEFEPLETYRQNIVSPIRQFLTGSGQNIRYVVIMHGCPSRIRGFAQSGVAGFFYPYSAPRSVDDAIFCAFEDGAGRSGPIYNYASNTSFSLIQYSGTAALVTRVSMGTKAATIGYIDKLKNLYTALSMTGLIIAPSRFGYNNTGYYLDDRCVVLDDYPWVDSTWRRNLTGAYPAAAVTYTRSGNIVGNRINPTAYISWGYNGGLGQHYQNSIQWSGANQAWVMTSIESFNGYIDGHGFQGSFSGWFQSGAWGGTGYECCPLGAVCAVEEPYLNGLPGERLLTLWETGLNWPDCVWNQRPQVGNYAQYADNKSLQTSYLMCVGDPLVAK